MKKDDEGRQKLLNLLESLRERRDQVSKAQNGLRKRLRAAAPRGWQGSSRKDLGAGSSQGKGEKEKVAGPGVEKLQEE